MEPMQRRFSMDELRTRDPAGYAFMQLLIQTAVQRHPEIVKDLSVFGIAGEQLHEAMEGLLEKGFLRFRAEEGYDPGEMDFYLQVYDILRLEYRDVGAKPWD